MRWACVDEFDREEGRPLSGMFQEADAGATAVRKRRRRTLGRVDRISQGGVRYAKFEMTEGGVECRGNRDCYSGQCALGENGMKKQEMQWRV